MNGRDQFVAGCVFCDRVDTVVVDETESMLTRLDNYPANPGHVNIIPKRHVEALGDLTDAEAAELWWLFRRARARIDAEYAPGGCTIGVNEGPASGHSIAHLHVHVIPRHFGDVPDPAGGIRQGAPNWPPSSQPA